MNSSLHVVLVEPEIHGNTGNIGRTCLAVGAQLHLVEPLGFSLDDAKVRRAGLDYWPRVDPRVWRSWAEVEPELAGMGEAWFFTAEAERVYWDADLRGPTVLVFGRESVGLDPEIRERYAERCLRFPVLDDGVRSLNLANCVALAAYEVLRQRRDRGSG
ncbi:MAG: tRNA (cytidine(34)-2'-O)-methyltransferase [Acidobacteriota bacterium]